MPAASWPGSVQMTLNVPTCVGVNVDIPAKTVRVQFDESRVDLEQIKAAVEDEEYPVAAVE